MTTMPETRMRQCRNCGRECYGRECRDCFSSKKHGRLSKARRYKPSTHRKKTLPQGSMDTPHTK